MGTVITFLQERAEKGLRGERQPLQRSPRRGSPKSTDVQSGRLTCRGGGPEARPSDPLGGGLELPGAARLGL